MSEPDTQLPCRGVIIPDKKIMRSLSLAVPEKFRDRFHAGGGIDYFYQTLPFLAEQGFKIVIPEMVLCDTCHMLAGGEDFRTFFPDSSAASPVEPRYKQFMHDVIMERYPGISIAPCTGPEYVKNYMDQLHSVFRRYPQRCADAIDEIRKIQEKRKKNSGEKSIDALLPQYLQQKDVPVFYVSNKYEPLFHAMATHNSENLSALNLLGFLQAFNDKQVYRALGLKKEATPYIIKEYMHEHDRLLRDKKPHHLVAHHATSLQPVARSEPIVKNSKTVVVDITAAELKSLLMQHEGDHTAAIYAHHNRLFYSTMLDVTQSLGSTHPHSGASAKLADSIQKPAGNYEDRTRVKPATDGLPPL